MSRISFVLLLFLSINIHAQESSTKDKKIEFKLYTNFDFSPKHINYKLNNTAGISRHQYKREINGFNFSPAIVYYNKQGNSFEVEVSRLKYANNYYEKTNVKDSSGSVINIIDGNIHKQFDLFIRFEYKMLLFNKEYWRILKPYIGFAATPFISWNKNEPKLSTEFTNSETIMGINLSLIPRVEYIINDKWYLDLNIPITVVNANYSILKDDNPALTTDQRIENIFDFYSSPFSFAIRFGLGYRF